VAISIKDYLSISLDVLRFLIFVRGCRAPGQIMKSKNSFLEEDLIFLILSSLSADKSKKNDASSKKEWKCNP